MSVRMRIVQQFSVRHEREFMELEKRFAELEESRPNFSKGRRLQPIAGPEPSHTLVWEGDFPDLEAAREALDFFAGDAEHQTLFKRQSCWIDQARVEFYRLLEFGRQE
jgi:hypothetical protein